METITEIIVELRKLCDNHKLTLTQYNDFKIALEKQEEKLKNCWCKNLEFTKNDWDHMHDCVLHATWKTTQKNCNREELQEIFHKLPEDLKLDAYKYGMSDTCWREEFIKHYKQKYL